MITQWPRIFEFGKQRGESAQNYEDRMRSTNTRTTKHTPRLRDNGRCALHSAAQLGGHPSRPLFS